MKYSRIYWQHRGVVGLLLVCLRLALTFSLGESAVNLPLLVGS